MELENKLKDEKFIDDVKVVLKIVKIGFTAATGNALYRLQETKANIDAVKELIHGFLVQCASRIRMLSYQSNQRFGMMLLLSNIFPLSQRKESNMKSVAEECVVDCWLQIQLTEITRTLFNCLLACLGNASDPIPDDTAFLDALKELRKDIFLLKEDIKDHHLLYWS